MREGEQRMKKGSGKLALLYEAREAQGVEAEALEGVQAMLLADRVAQ